MRKKNIPQHVGIIMDGNRRWARKHGLKLILGHEKAADNTIEPLIEKAGEMGIKYITFWAFSTENWRREKSEVLGLMDVFRKVLKTKILRFHKKGARIRILGDMEKFPEDIRKGVEEAVKLTKNNNKINVNFAINYGGRNEIVRAANKIITSRQDKSNKLERHKGQVEIGEESNKLRKITEEDFEKYLDTGGMEDPDLIIRTGGEQRLSGFLTWQSVYSELYFTETLFPDFTPEEFEKAIGEFSKRQRRFGK